MEPHALSYMFQGDAQIVPYFCGIIPADHLTYVKTGERPKTYVLFNEHHYSLAVLLKDKCFFADTVCPTMVPYGLTKYLIRNNHPVFFNLPFALQATTSKLCGLYTLYFAKNLLSNCPWDKICAKFAYLDKLANDFYLIDWFRKTYKFSPSQLFDNSYLTLSGTKVDKIV